MQQGAHFDGISFQSTLHTTVKRSAPSVRLMMFPRSCSATCTSASTRPPTRPTCSGGRLPDSVMSGAVLPVLFDRRSDQLCRLLDRLLDHLASRCSRTPVTCPPMSRALPWNRDCVTTHPASEPSTPWRLQLVPHILPPAGAGVPASRRSGGAPRVALHRASQGVPTRRLLKCPSFLL